jgi:SET domain-containing protein
MQYFIKQCEQYGRGLYAATDLQGNKILFSAELLVLSEQDTRTVASTELRDYVFTFDERRDCLVLGDGELFNHSDVPNVGYKLGKHAERTVMYFYTLVDVTAGSQLFIDYKKDLREGEKLAQYATNLMSK